MTRNFPSRRGNLGPATLASRAGDARARWPRRGPHPPREISEISRAPLPPGSGTFRDDLSRAVALHLARILTVRLVAAAVVVAGWWWSPWLGGALVVVWLLWRWSR